MTEIQVVLPTKDDWARVELARTLYAEHVELVGEGAEAVLIEGVVALCAKEEGWDDSEQAMVLALMLGNATPENLMETVIPF